MFQVGKGFIAVGGLLLVVGFVLCLASRVPGLNRLGNLPGDIRIELENFKFYFPLATSILVSVILSLVFYFLRRR